MFKRLVKFYRWPLSFKSLLLEAIYLSVLSEFYLRFNGYQSIKSLHENREVSGQILESELAPMRQIAKAMKLLEKFAPWRPKCYNRALTAKKMLLKRGIDTTMHIGFIKKEESFEGHAWLTYKGVLVTGFVKGLQNYRKLEGRDILQNYKTSS